MSNPLVTTNDIVELKITLARIEERLIAQTASHMQANAALVARVEDLETFRTWFYRGGIGGLVTVAFGLFAAFGRKVGLAS